MGPLLFIEINGYTITPWEMILGAFFILVSVGAAVKAFKEIRKDGWEPFRDRWIRPWLIKRKRTDELMEKFDGMTTAFTMFGTRLEEIGNELKTNGGGSLRDMVTAIGDSVQKIQARIDNQDETSPQPIFHLNENGEMCYTNEAFRDMVDAEDKDLIKKNYLARIISKDRRILDAEISDAIAKKMPFDTTVAFNLHGSGQTIAVRLRARPNVVSGGELRGFIGMASEVRPN